MKEKKLSSKEIIIVTVTLVLICAITAALLSFVDTVTREPIEENKKAATENAMKSVLENAAQFNEIMNASELEGTIYEGVSDSGEVLGYAVSTLASGYGGKVEVMTGFDRDGEITAIAIISADDETPGLGLKIKNEEFLIQFEGKSVPLTLVTASQKTGADNEIDAVTSATYSSRAVVNAVNAARDIYVVALGGED